MLPIGLDRHLAEQPIEPLLKKELRALRMRLVLNKADRMDFYFAQQRLDIVSDAAHSQEKAAMRFEGALRPRVYNEPVEVVLQ